MSKREQSVSNASRLSDGSSSSNHVPSSETSVSSNVGRLTRVNSTQPTFSYVQRGTSRFPSRVVSNRGGSNLSMPDRNTNRGPSNVSMLSRSSNKDSSSVSTQSKNNNSLTSDTSVTYNPTASVKNKMQISREKIRSLELSGRNVRNGSSRNTGPNGKKVDHVSSDVGEADYIPFDHSDIAISRSLQASMTVLEPPEKRPHFDSIGGVTSEIFLTQYNQRLPLWRTPHEQDPNLEKWSNRFEFITGTCAFTINIYSVLFMPIFAIFAGGVPFLIAFVVLSVLVGIPLLFFEVAIGQFSGKGPGEIFRTVPVAKGMGGSLLMIGALVSIRQIAIVSHIVYYLFDSFRSTVPWLNDAPNFNGSRHENWDRIEFYYQTKVLNVQGPDEIGLGTLHWPLVGCLAFCWALIFFGICGSVRTLGKIARVMIPLVYFIYIILLICVLTQAGSTTGLSFFFNTIDSLDEFNTWIQAFESVVMTMGFGLGINILSGSYSRFQSPAHIDCLVVSLLTLCISILSCLFIFAGFGVISHKKNIAIPDLLNSITVNGESVVPLTIYPYMLYQLAAPTFWYIIFFLMTIVIAIATILALISMLSRSLYTLYPRLRECSTRTSFTLVLSLFLLTLPFVTQGANKLDTSMNKSVWYQEAMVILELFAFVVCYGMKQLKEDIHFMLHYRPNRLYCISWILSPALFLIFIVMSMYQESNLETLQTTWMENLNLCLLFLILLPTLCFAVYAIVKYCRQENLKGAFRPGSDHPALARGNDEVFLTLGESTSGSQETGGQTNITSVMALEKQTPEGSANSRHRKMSQGKSKQGLGTHVPGPEVINPARERRRESMTLAAQVKEGVVYPARERRRESETLPVHDIVKERVVYHARERRRESVTLPGREVVKEGVVYPAWGRRRESRTLAAQEVVKEGVYNLARGRRRESVTLPGHDIVNERVVYPAWERRRESNNLYFTGTPDK